MKTLRKALMLAVAACAVSSANVMAADLGAGTTDVAKDAAKDVIEKAPGLISKSWTKATKLVSDNCNACWSKFASLKADADGSTARALYALAQEGGAKSWEYLTTTTSGNAVLGVTIAIPTLLFLRWAYNRLKSES